MADPSVPPSVQAWDAAKEAGWVDVVDAGDALRAENLRLREAATKFLDALEHAAKVRRDGGTKHVEAAIAASGAKDRLRAALGSVSSEPPREHENDADNKCPGCVKGGDFPHWVGCSKESRKVS